MSDYKKEMDYYKGKTASGQVVIGAHFFDENAEKHFIITKIDGLTHISFFPVEAESIERCNELGVKLAVNFEDDFENYQIEQLKALKRLAEEDPEAAKKYAKKNLQKAGILDENGWLAEPYQNYEVKYGPKL